MWWEGRWTGAPARPVRPDDKTRQKLVTQGEARAEEIDVADSIGEARQKQTVDRRWCCGCGFSNRLPRWG